MANVKRTAKGPVGPLFPFLATHSLLIGLVPFFVPVWLWQSGMRVAGLAVLIGTSGLAFVLALNLWQKLASACSLRTLIGISLVLELILVGLIMTSSDWQLDAQVLSIPILIGVANGFYNAFFWTTQRVLFAQSLGQNDSGKRYGNFQIFVAVFLKVGILAGGLLLDFAGLPWLFAMSAAVALSSFFWIRQFDCSQPLYPASHQAAAITLWQSLRYKDRRNSGSIFAIDGLFLYLESHFWTVSLFLLVGEDFSRLGAVVVVLAIVFAALFWLLKNLIDSLVGESVFVVSVLLYAASWLIRPWLDAESGDSLLLVGLILITFFTSFFRLTFNKRFFDVARIEGEISYLLIKSYASQCWLGLSFLFIGLLLLFLQLHDMSVLNQAYLPAAALSLLYLRYRAR